MPTVTRSKVEATKERWAEENPQYARFVESIDVDTETNPFVADVVRKFHRFGYLTERQAQAIMKAKEGDRKYAERQARWAEERANAADAPTGKATFEGSVVHHKTVESRYGVQWKMMVKAEDGSRVWVTVPKAIESKVAQAGGTLVGSKVRFTATFEQSEDDPTFAFGKRPTKAEVVEVGRVGRDERNG